eukprot:jgi/Ulvmu1/10251/UM060_0052.1
MAWCITHEALRGVCRKHKLYEHRPELNDVLYLHHKGITKLENLQEFRGLKTLYLECNAIQTIENIDHMTGLRCLYMANNVLKSIAGIQTLKSLWTLDVSHNALESLAPLASLDTLRSISATHNKLANPDGLEALKCCTNLQTLDLGNNRIAAEESLSIILQLPVSLLRLVGNPVVSKTRNFRKTVMLAMPALQNLDDMPCFEKDRRLARAHARGGVEAERAEREVIAVEKAATRERHRAAFNDMMARARLEHAQAQAAEKVAAEAAAAEAAAAEKAAMKEAAAENAAAQAAAAEMAAAAEENMQRAAAAPPAVPAADADAGVLAAAACAEDAAAGDPEQCPAEAAVTSKDTAASAPEEDAVGSRIGGPVASSCHGGSAGTVSVDEMADVAEPGALDAAGAEPGEGVAAPSSPHMQGILDAVSVEGGRQMQTPSGRSKTAVWNTAGYKELWQLALRAGQEQEDSTSEKIAAVHARGSCDSSVAAVPESDDVGGAPLA